MPDGNRHGRIIAKVGLTVRLTGRAGTKVGDSDPVPELFLWLKPRGWGIAQRIKVTLGITG